MIKITNSKSSTVYIHNAMSYIGHLIKTGLPVLHNHQSPEENIVPNLSLRQSENNRRVD